MEKREMNTNIKSRLNNKEQKKLEKGKHWKEEKIKNETKKNRRKDKIGKR